MDLSIKLYTIKSGGSIVYIEDSQVISKEYCILFLEDDLVLANRADADEMVIRTLGQFGKFISLHHNDTMRL